ncbi:MAG: 50S ribosomal protein L24 [Candidatus Paceibacterota bacterium]
MKIKKGDNVIIIAGKDKGKKGKVSLVLRETDRLAVSDANLATRRLRPKKSGAKGQIAKVAIPLHRSNVMLFCTKCNQGTRMKSVVKKDQKKRACVKCEQEL